VTEEPVVKSLLLLFFLSVPVQAEATVPRATPADASLDRLVAMALAAAPEVAAARAAVETARLRVIPAKTLPDPWLNTTFQNEGRTLSLGEAEGSFAGLMLSQAFPWPGKLALAANVAESEAREVETAMLGRAALRIEARVRNAWYDLVLARALARLVEERRATARQIEETTRDRYAAGLAIQQDVLRAQVELARIDEMAAVQRAAITSSLAAINRLIGRPHDSTIDTPVELPAIEPLTAESAAAWIASVRERSPEARAARQGIETAQLQVSIAKKSFLPDFVVSAGSMYRGSFAMGPMWQAGVGVSLPLWIGRRQENQLAEARARTAGRTAEADAVERDAELRSRERVAPLEAANDAAIVHRDRILPLDQLSLESAQASYAAGKIPFITVLDAVNTLYGDRANYLTRLAEAAKWRVAIDEAGQ
jgi:outer membrane protein TolC